MAAVETFLARLGIQWKGLSGGQRLVLISMVASIAISVLVFSVWLRKPDMVMLASDLDPSAANEVVQALDSRGAEYRVGDGGRSILVDRKLVAELRVLLASSNALSGSMVGYELFDNEKIGITEFAQRINLQRALEGELSRTISDLNAVDKARVHIAIPKESVFLEADNQATASVVLRLKRGRQLTGQQIQGIANLVSFSIDGLNAENVSIVDDNGDVLKGDSSNNSGASTANLGEQQRIEGYLAGKAEGLLEEVVGPNHARVAVNVTLNWEQVQQTKEYYDPAKTVVRSEERNESTSPADGSSNESSVTNYEMDKTIENVLSAVGTVNHLSVAAFIDHAGTTDGSGDVIYQPRSEDELRQLEAIVKTAVGFDADRGDKISVVNMRFSTESPLDEEAGVFGSPLMEMLPDLIGKLISIGIVVGLLLALRKRLNSPPARTTMQTLVDRAHTTVASGHVDVNADEMNRASMEDQVRGVAASNPENVAKLMKTWMVNESGA